MKICVLQSSFQDSEVETKDYDEAFDPTPYLKAHQVEVHPINKKSAVRQVTELTKKGFDVFFNLCDGAWDEDRAGVEVVQTLERANVAFTGSDSYFYEPPREHMKLGCYQCGIKSPLFVMAADADEVEEAVQNLSFPMIVKHPSGYNSVGITRESLVNTSEQLREQSLKMISRFGRALIEEFIAGREFTALVAENPDDEKNPVVFQPCEVTFPEGETFKHFDLKWVTYHKNAFVMVDDHELAERIKDVCRRYFVAMKGRGYGRCDLRMNEAGELYMLEVNPNCSLFYPLDDPGSGDFILMNDPIGHQGFVELLLRSAFKKKRPLPKYRVRSNRNGYFGIFAQQNISAGEIIYRNEEAPHILASKSHVMKNWDAEGLRDFAQFAYPLSEDVFVLWSDDPMQWKPINHSCDPNSWVTGLDLTARRDIRKGEEITIDYATFCNETMEEFNCGCGSPNCRGVISGKDHEKPFLDLYGEHVSDFVRLKRRKV
ncbi:MAG: SET domain-containing protein-lysine N-methyltransferase [Candidatus Rifleibacteriota bacterium]